MNLLKYTGTGLFIVLFSLLCLPLSGSEIPEQIPKTALICEKAYNNAGSEVRATFDYLKSLSPQAGYLTFKDIRHHPRLLSGYSVLWFQRNDTTVFSEMETNRKIIHSLRDFIQNGGSLLLTGEAFRYILPLGLENISPQDSLKRSMDEGYGRKLGFHAWKDHPIFSGMNGGSYILMPFKDTTVRITGYFGKFLPENGKVVAVDWDYIFMRETSKIVVEYGLGKGKVLAVGGYMAFSSLNMNRKHLDFFTQNVLKYLAGETLSSFPNYWDYSESQINKAFPPSSVFPPFIIPESKTWIIPDNPMTLKAKYASGNSWDVASERLLTMGTEYGGIKEVWAHPFMAFRDYEAGIRFSYSDTIYWFTDEHPEIQVMPDGLVREYKFSRGYLKEVIVNDPSEPAGVIHYEYQGVYPAELILRFNSNLRIMWPYSENVNRLIRHSWLDSIQAFFAGDKSGELCLLFGANKKPDMKLEGQFEGFIPIKGKKEFEGIPTSAFKASFLLCYPLGMNDRMDVVYAASGEGFDKTFYSYKKAISDPYAIFSRAKEHISSLFHNNLQITTPDSGFNLGYQWAMLGTDRFMVNTPGMGRSVVAGYATTENGWDGEQKVSGRPGYSWYFGRDGEWSGFAILDYGDFEKVKDILAFYKKYQDLSGKIFHEATTSGVIHYDAADATPLYIVLAGKYFRHTNDLEYLKSNWGSIRKAIDFCFSTDTDNDHLIENTNVGHGWIEGGKLYGSHATLYLNGIWASALDEAANMAKALGYAEADNYQQESKIVKQIINNDFWIDRIKFFSYGKNKDNSFRLEPTVLPAVPLYFHLAEEEKAGLILDRYAGNHFTTNWGIRIVGDESPLFNPTGYHYGSVWPLFTGWTSLAEYAYGRNDVAFSHLMENLSIYRYWGLGFIE
ncbi:MAG: GH116 family glycosyl hydrolase, partial [Bacteroidota bacterium]|nr:GH116 family glycosyl hydrolase [Bacteroidota bacterium]